jgi:hypothetical protein
MKIEVTNGVETPVTKFFSTTPQTDAAIKAQAEWRRPFISYTMNGVTWDGPVADLCRRLERERDEWRNKFDLSVDAVEIAACLARAESERDEARKHCESIVDKAKELIARWDQPSWKDTAPTARFINALRIAVRAYEERLK